ncbi:MAG TPA: type II secretion system F family protein, partial [Isosphaeraceae bacterium]|nr:type II secretion system F family protein [Isosphaeraceae bacterium]
LTQSQGSAMASVPRSAPRQRLSIIHLMLLVLGCAIIFRVFSVSGVMITGGSIFALVGFPILLIPVMIFAYSVAIAARRESQQDALLWVIVIAAEKQLPLAPGLYAVADQYGGRFHRQVIALANWLNAGLALPDALDRVTGLLPKSATVLIRVGWETGVLPAALREAARVRAVQPLHRNPLAGKFFYLIGMLFVIQSICGFILYFIIPKFEAIFADFQVRLPEVTIFVIGLSHALVSSGALAMIVLVEFGLLLYLPLSYFGWARSPVSLFDRLLRRQHTIRILRSLAVVAEGGVSLSSGVAALARFYPGRWVRRRLEHVQEAMSQGADWWDCLRWQGLIRRSEAAVLESAQRAGNVPWALRELAESSQRRLVYRLQALTQLLFPLVVIGIGGVVFLMAVAYFSPLVTLIRELGE